MTICTRATAIHEAGHIVAAKRYLLGYYEIIVRPDGGPIIDGRGRKSYDLAMMDGSAFDYDVMGEDHISKWNFGDDHTDMVLKINELGFRHLLTTQARSPRPDIAAVPSLRSLLAPAMATFDNRKALLISCHVQRPTRTGYGGTRRKRPARSSAPSGRPC